MYESGESGCSGIGVRECAAEYKCLDVKERFCTMIGLLLTKLNSLGLRRFFQAGASVAVNFALQKVYRFDPWHIGGNFYSRPYKAHVIALAELHQPETVVEIGAGLCDIIGRIKARQRIGMDLDDKVLKAARHMVSRDVKLVTANFLDVENVIVALQSQDVRAIDCLILVNWIHMIGIDEITSVLRGISKKIPIRHVLFDAIKADASGYRHHHSAADFARIGNIIKTTAGDEVRDLVLVEMIAHP